MITRLSTTWSYVLPMLVLLAIGLACFSTSQAYSDILAEISERDEFADFEWMWPSTLGTGALHDSAKFGQDLTVYRQLAAGLFRRIKFDNLPAITSPADDWLTAGVEIRTSSANYISAATTIAPGTYWLQVYELTPDSAADFVNEYATASITINNITQYITYVTGAAGLTVYATKEIFTEEKTVWAHRFEAGKRLIEHFPGPAVVIGGANFQEYTEIIPGDTVGTHGGFWVTLETGKSWPVGTVASAIYSTTNVDIIPQTDDKDVACIGYPNWNRLGLVYFEGTIVSASEYLATEAFAWLSDESGNVFRKEHGL